MLEQLITGAQTVTGHVVNSGAIELAGGAGNVLSVGGNYTGGGVLLVDVVGDNADRMDVAGDVLGNPTLITVRSLTGGNSGSPIDVVTVGGSTQAGDFTASDFTLGAYSYSLALDGNVWQFVATSLSEGARSTRSSA